MRSVLITLLLLGTLSLLSACGGGSNHTTASVRIMTNGTLPSGTRIGGIEVTLDLPDGVSVRATADSQNPGVLVTDQGVVTVAGSNTTALGTYTTNPNRVTLQVANADGFGTGEFVTVTCDIASDTSVTASGFGVGGLVAVDLNGTRIAGLTPGMTTMWWH